MANRDELSGYPCPIGSGTMMCNTTCANALDACDAVTCSWLPVYRQAIADHKAYIALRKAVLGDMTPDGAARMYRSQAVLWHELPRGGIKRHLEALADVAEGL